MDYQIRTEQEQAAFFEQVMQTTLRAEEGAPVQRVALQVAGLRVDLRFIGDALQPLLMPALSHLVVLDDTPGKVTLRLWDGKSTRVSFPPPPCTRDLSLIAEIFGASPARAIARPSIGWSTR